MTGQVLYQRDGTLAHVILAHRPRKNALDLAMWRQLAETFAALSADETLRCVIIRGEGEDFAAGGDLVEMAQRRTSLEAALDYHETVGAALDAIADCPHPTIAAIRGVCAGGGLAIACACDLRIADATARLGIPINRLGFSLYPGELARLMAVAGTAVVRELLLEGRLLSAQEAYQKGLLTRLVMQDWHSEIMATAQRIAQGAPLVARAHKQWITRLSNRVLLTEEDKRAAFAFLASEDYREGMQAFLEKRTPRFRGR
ncbi:MAG: enoyl-CoA hydratase-related protein [Rhodocyclaceae bacterium]|nr:enoyl-CoA hydratase-related protein [Rhodocyclaceae bacterium]